MSDSQKERCILSATDLKTRFKTHLYTEAQIAHCPWLTGGFLGLKLARRGWELVGFICDPLI